MTETNATDNISNGEVDLLDLFQRIGRGISRFFRALGRGILISTVFLMRRWLPLSLSVLAGIALAYIAKIVLPPFYESDMVVRSNTVSNSEMIGYINRLHKICQEDNFAGLADALSIQEEQARNIIDISAFWVIDKGRDGIPDIVDYKNRHSVYDTVDIRMQDRFDIRSKVKKTGIFSSIRSGIASFINSDSLFSQRNRLRIKQNSEILARLDVDIQQLDSLQKVKYFEETRNLQPKNGGQIIFLQEHNTQLVYNDIYSLYARKQSIEVEQNLFNKIATVTTEFTIPVKRVNRGLYYAVRIVPAMFVIVLLILVIIANRKKLEEVYIKY